MLVVNNNIIIVIKKANNSNLYVGALQIFAHYKINVYANYMQINVPKGLINIEI